jgi:NADH-quinone oxidoreductase subunit C
MEALEQIKARIEAAVPGAKIEIVSNPGPANQPSLLLDHQQARAVAKFLRDDPGLNWITAQTLPGWTGSTARSRKR